MAETLLAKHLRHAREQRGLTQEQLAEAAQVTTGTISDYERDVRRPNTVNLKALARALGTTVDELLREPGDGRVVDLGALLAMLGAARKVILTTPRSASAEEVRQRALTAFEMVEGVVQR